MLGGVYCTRGGVAVEFQQPGYDAQSDREAAVFLCPWHYCSNLVSSESGVTDIKVPWSLQGALLINVVAALATTAVYHPNLPAAVRLENCSWGHQSILHWVSFFVIQNKRHISNPASPSASGRLDELCLIRPGTDGLRAGGQSSWTSQGVHLAASHHNGQPAAALRQGEHRLRQLRGGSSLVPVAEYRAHAGSVFRSSEGAIPLITDVHA